MTKILQLSDIHFGVEIPEAVDAAAEFALQHKPDAIVVCGDITQTGAKSEFRRARDWLQRLPGQTLLTPGNHDTPMFNLWLRATDPFGRFKKYVGDLVIDRFQNRDIAIAGLNTSRGWQIGFDWSLGVVSQKDLLKEITWLQKSAPRALKFVACHHPFVYPVMSPLQGKTRGGARSKDILKTHGIDGLLSGHIHVALSMGSGNNPDDTLTISSGTLSNRDRGAAPSFNLLTVVNRHLKVEQYSWREKEFLLSKTHEFNRRAALESKYGT